MIERVAKAGELIGLKTNEVPRDRTRRSAIWTAVKRWPGGWLPPTPSLRQSAAMPLPAGGPWARTSPDLPERIAGRRENHVDRALRNTPHKSWKSGKLSIGGGRR